MQNKPTSITLSEEERQLLALSFRLSQAKAELRMYEQLPLLKRCGVTFDYAFAKGWQNKLQPGTTNLTITGNSELRMFLRLVQANRAEFAQEQSVLESLINRLSQEWSESLP